jgi:hypothetical protein
MHAEPIKLLPRRKSRGVSKPVPYTINRELPAPVHVYRQMVDLVRDREIMSGDNSNKVEQWNDVIRLIDNEEDYDDWFTKALQEFNR